MSSSRCRALTMALCALAVVLAVPADNLWAGCLGCFAGGAAPVATTTYYAPYAVSYAPACATCAPPAYMPSSVYRALYRPTVVSYQPACQTVYQPVYGSYAVTTYRPFLGTYTTRLVPYTAYQPVYVNTPVVACSNCNTCPVYCDACSSCSPCSSCSACGSCGGVSYAAPASGCASCAASATTVSPAQSGNAIQQAPPQKTFDEKVQKPAPETNLKPIPQTDGQLNSTPVPLLPNPRDRTAAVRTAVYSAARVDLTAAPARASQSLDADGWEPARD